LFSAIFPCPHSTLKKTNIINTCSILFEGLDNMTRKKLIRNLTKSLTKQSDAKEIAFFKSLFKKERIL